MIRKQLHLPRQRRIIKGGVFLLASLIVTLGYSRVISWENSQRVQVAELTLSLDRMRSAVTARNAIDSSFIAVSEEQLRTDTLLIPGHTSASITWNVNEELQNAAGNNDVQLGNVQISFARPNRRNFRSTRPLTNVSARFTATGASENVLHFLSWLEETPPLISIKELTIAPNATQPESNKTIVRAELVLEARAMLIEREGEIGTRDKRVRQ